MINFLEPFAAKFRTIFRSNLELTAENNLTPIVRSLYCKQPFDCSLASIIHSEINILISGDDYLGIVSELLCCVLILLYLLFMMSKKQRDNDDTIQYGFTCIT